MENIKNILNDIYDNDNRWHFRIINSNTAEVGTITDVNKTKLGFGKEYKIWVEFPFQDRYNSNSFILTPDDINKLSAGQKINIKAEQPLEENPYSTIEYSNETFSDRPRVTKSKSSSGNSDFLTGVAIGSLFKNGGLTPEKASMILHEGKVHGRPITEQQRKLFGAISSGYPLRKKGYGGYMEKGGDTNQLNLRFKDKNGKSPEVGSFILDEDGNIGRVERFFMTDYNFTNNYPRMVVDFRSHYVEFSPNSVFEIFTPNEKLKKSFSKGGMMYEKGGEVELQFLKGIEIGKSHWWAPKNISTITQVSFDKDKNIYEINTAAYSLKFPANEMKSLMQEGSGLDEEGIKYELIKDDDDTAFVFIPMHFNNGGIIENLVDKLKPKFGKLIHDLGITEIYFVDGEFYMTSEYEVSPSSADAIEKQARSMARYTIIDEAGDIVEDNDTEQDVIEYANALFEYDRWDAEAEPINNISDAIRELKKSEFKITEKFQNGGIIKSAIDFLNKKITLNDLWDKK